MQRQYRFAGVEYAIVAEPDVIFDQECTLAPFRVDSNSNPHYIRIEKVDQLPPPEGERIAQEPALLVYSNGVAQMRYFGSVGVGWQGAYLCARHEGMEHRVLVRKDIFPGRIGVKTVLEAMEAVHLIARAGGFVFHCSYIEWQGRAVLFTAPSETGKSTQASLWNRFRGTEIINGDRAAVRVTADAILAEGIPFSGSSVFCENRSLPLAAVVYLAQAPVTSIRQLRGYEAFAKIWEGCSVNTWDREDMDRVSEAVRTVAQKVPVFYMPCRPDESAVIALENALKEVGR
jgi:hypothetical protein